MNSIDLNADVGESPRALADGSEERLIARITSANIACGGHAGDDESMRAAMRLCARYGVGIGAHPSYPDPAGFGREEMNLTAKEIADAVCGQITRLIKLAEGLGAVVRHVKPHGALYNKAARDAETARAVAKGVARTGRSLLLYGLAGSPCLDLWRREGLTVIAEAFADRRYEPDGSLRSRKHADALISDPDAASRQAVEIATLGKVLSVSGAVVPLEAQSLCVHGDTPGAALIAERIRSALAENGVLARHPGGV